jgi:hypothetical protein
MHSTVFRLAVEAHSMLALEMTTSSVESIPSEPWKIGYSANDAEDGCTCGLDSYWIDIGGEG